MAIIPISIPVLNRLIRKQVNVFNILITTVLGYDLEKEASCLIHTNAKIL